MNRQDILNHLKPLEWEVGKDWWLFSAWFAEIGFYAITQEKEYFTWGLYYLDGEIDEGGGVENEATARAEAQKHYEELVLKLFNLSE